MDKNITEDNKFKQAYQYEDEYDYYKAIFYYLELLENNEYSNFNKDIINIRISNCFLLADDIKSSKQYLSKIIDHNYESYYILSCCSTEEDEINNYLKLSIEKNPYDIKAYNKQAEIYYKNNEYDKIFLIYENFLDKNHNNKELHMQCLIKIAGFHIRLKNYEKCINTLDSCLSLDPSNQEEIFLMKAQALMFLNKYSEAEN